MLLFEDNWFSSYDVVRMLKQRGIEYVATFCQSRKGDQPAEYIFPKSGPNKRRRGEICCVGQKVIPMIVLFI